MPAVVIDGRRNPATVYENVDVALARMYALQAAAGAAVYPDVDARVSALEYLAGGGIVVSALSVNPAIAEVGSTVTAPVLTATRAGAAPTAQTLTWPGDSFALAAGDVSKTLIGKSFTADTTFAWTATDASAPGSPASSTKTATLIFAQKGHAGTINKTSGITSAEVNAMSQSWFATAVGRTLSFTTTADGYLWYSQPASQAEPSVFKLDGFVISPVKFTFSHTTATGQVVSYNAWLLSDFMPAGTANLLEVFA